MASVASVSASPSQIAPGGGTSRITPVVTNIGTTATVTVTIDGSSGTAPITISEQLVQSVNPSDVGKRGYLVATVDQGGTLVSNGDGTFTFTAA